METNWPWTRPASTRPLTSLPPQTHSARPPNIGVETQPIFSLPSPAPATHRQSFPPSKIPFRAGSWLSGPVPLARVSLGATSEMGPSQGQHPIGQTHSWSSETLDHRGLQFSMLPASLRSILRQCILPTYMKKLYDMEAPVTACGNFHGPGRAAFFAVLLLYDGPSLPIASLNVTGDWWLAFPSLLLPPGSPDLGRPTICAYYSQHDFLTTGRLFREMFLSCSFE